MLTIASTVGRVHGAADKIFEADLAQLIMVLVTTSAAVTYGWIEGYVIRENLTNRPFTWFGHFSSYQLAVGLLLGLTTGGFALVKSRSMFTKGNMYFLFSVLGNYPFSWLIEDFTYFLFNPLDTLSSHAWSTWFLGGIYVYNPWLPGAPKPEFFVPNWYLCAFAWFVGFQLFAHRCTIYDNLVKDELGHQILPDILPKPSPMPVVEHVEESPHPTRVRAELRKVEPAPKKETPLAPPPKTLVPIPKSKVRSEDAQAALKHLRERWMKNGSERT